MWPVDVVLCIFHSFSFQLAKVMDKNVFFFVFFFLLLLLQKYANEIWIKSALELIWILFYYCITSPDKYYKTGP